MWLAPLLLLVLAFQVSSRDVFDDLVASILGLFFCLRFSFVLRCSCQLLLRRVVWVFRVFCVLCLASVCLCRGVWKENLPAGSLALCCACALLSLLLDVRGVRAPYTPGAPFTGLAFFNAK